jgi:glucose-6-phosphate 1-dehydrogenase
MKLKRSDAMQKAIVSDIATNKESCAEPLPEAFGLTIFGASGDLTKRKLIPALFNVMKSGLLPDSWYVVGLGRTKMDDNEFRKTARESLNLFLPSGSVSASDAEKFEKRLYYLAGDSEDPGYYKRLKERFAQLDKEHGVEGNRLFYLATPPNLYPGIIKNLGAAGLNRPAGSSHWSRIIIEKPFGTDLPSAKALNQELLQSFREGQVYRIDHYLGKETVQNILFFRFANAIFEPTWNRRYIDHVQITVAESIGIEHRAGYYEQTGALRDMFPNHLLQLLSLVAMEPPAAFEADAVRDEKAKVLKAVRPIPAVEIAQFAVRGQYGPGVVNGQQTIGYRSEPGVKPDSKTETFFALKFYIDNWRWEGVPFYLRSGKRLPKRVAEISVEFKRVPHLFFKSLIPEQIEPNTLVFRIQPDEGISTKFQAKHPGPKVCMDTVTMDFSYQGSFKVVSPEAYERLLLDCLAGDQMLFSRRDWVENSWSVISTVLEQWQKTPEPGFPNYQAGSWGPGEADKLIEQDGQSWRSL